MMVVVVVMVMGPKERLRGMGSDEGGVGRRWDKARGFWGGGGGDGGSNGDEYREIEMGEMENGIRMKAVDGKT